MYGDWSRAQGGREAEELYQRELQNDENRCQRGFTKHWRGMTPADRVSTGLDKAYTEWKVSWEDARDRDWTKRSSPEDLPPVDVWLREDAEITERESPSKRLWSSFAKEGGNTTSGWVSSCWTKSLKKTVTSTTCLEEETKRQMIYSVTG